MAYICYKPKGSCPSCEYRRWDADEGRYACFAATDAQEAAKKKKYLLTVSINCNTANNVTRTVYDNYAEAAREFNRQCRELVESYAEEGETYEQWMDIPGVITNEYCGIVKNDYLEFDGNVISLEVIERKEDN